MGLSAASKRSLLKNTHPAYAKEAQHMAPHRTKTMKTHRTEMQKELAKKPIKKTGTYKGESNKLGYGGRSAQLKARGVPGGVIGALARAAGAAPGQKNYHSSRKRKA